MAQLHNFTKFDGFNKFREENFAKANQVILQRIEEIQNPIKFTKEKKIVFNIRCPFPCGYGCQIHHILGCVKVGYYLNRTTILDSTDWNYNPKGFDSYFKNFSDTCKNIEPYEKNVSFIGKLDKILFI